MTKLTAVLAAAALVVGGAAYAQTGMDKSKQSQGTQSGQMQGHMGMQQQMGMQNELSGQIVRVERDTLYVRHMGAIVPLEINDDTRFTNLQRRDLREGREIRASFTVQDQTNNVALLIQPSTAQPMQQQPGMRQPTPPAQPTTPTQPGTGGTGETESPHGQY